VFGGPLWLLAATSYSRSQTLYERCATPADGSLLEQRFRETLTGFRLDRPAGLQVLALAVAGTVTGAIIAGSTTTQKRLFQYFKTR